MGQVLDSYNYYFLGMLFLFLLLNFNESIGMIYGFMILLTWMAYWVGRQLRLGNYPISSKRTGLLENLAWATGAYAAFVVITSQVFSVLGWKELASFNAILNIVGTTFSQAPVFAGSNFLSLLSWGVLIPYVETTALAVAFIWLAHWAKIDLRNPLSRGVAAVIIFISFAVTAFHYSAKGITNNPALVATFIFFFISLALIVYFKEVKQAITLHIISNTLATLQLLGISFLSVAGGGSASGTLPGVLILIGTVYMFHKYRSAHITSIGAALKVLQGRRPLGTPHIR